MLCRILWSSCRISELLQPIESGSNSLRVLPIGVKDNTLHASPHCEPWNAGIMQNSDFRLVRVCVPGLVLTRVFRSG